MNEFENLLNTNKCIEIIIVVVNFQIKVESRGK